MTPIGTSKGARLTPAGKVVRRKCPNCRRLNQVGNEFLYRCLWCGVLVRTLLCPTTTKPVVTWAESLDVVLFDCEWCGKEHEMPSKLGYTQRPPVARLTVSKQTIEPAQPVTVQPRVVEEPVQRPAPKSKTGQFCQSCGRVWLERKDVCKRCRKLGAGRTVTVTSRPQPRKASRLVRIPSSLKERPAAPKRKPKGLPDAAWASSKLKGHSKHGHRLAGPIMQYDDDT